MIDETLRWTQPSADAVKAILRRANARMAIGVISKVPPEPARISDPMSLAECKRIKIRLNKRQQGAEVRRMDMLAHLQLISSEDAPVLAKFLYNTGKYKVNCSKTVSNDLHDLWKRGFLTYITQENENHQDVRAYWVK